MKAELEAKVFKNTEYPKRDKDPRGNEADYSVDVFTRDVDGLINVAFWDYGIKRWLFHVDTLCNSYENGELIEFVWMYAPEELKP